jgi:hypothetical protein
MNRGSEMPWGNPMPGLAAPSMGAPDGRPHRYSQAPSAARGTDGVPSAPEASSTNRLLPHVSEYSRPRGPQR